MRVSDCEELVGVTYRGKIRLTLCGVKVFEGWNI